MALNISDTGPHSIFYASIACRQSFEDCLTIKSLMNNEWAENRLAALNFWAVGVCASKKRASLDERLVFQPEMRAVITNLLMTLKAFVDECKKLGRLSMIQQSCILVTRFLGLKENDGNEDIGSGRGRRAEIETAPPEKPTHRSFSPWSDLSTHDPESETETEITTSNSPLTDAIRNTDDIFYRLTQLAAAIQRRGTTSHWSFDTTSRLQNADWFKNHPVLTLPAQSPDMIEANPPYPVQGRAQRLSCETETVLGSFDPELPEDLKKHLIVKLLAQYPELPEDSCETETVLGSFDPELPEDLKKHLIVKLLAQSPMFEHILEMTRKLEN